ncbi:polysaccharide deacetylase family protein [Roseobacter sp. N2S]|uniref:polysaccharide deacetylase family protein n=1 Tax=Roseobacter sp. N2S TaxID=2663844 RepID=UPI0028587900|nr:polysaccharide deacetylase family protein [Roseobacter sp. N2S]MDR6266690.1 peptidoglycan/xylan/chitin deacetylase (PgdA/CDA1 family) [Roseobacter sp. N2S]
MDIHSGRSKHAGGLIFSLDFELMWGVCDKRTIADYGANILGARQAIPRMLDMFANHNISATWATVGLLFFEDKEALMAGLPTVKPCYKNASLSAYSYLPNIGRDEKTDPYHFGLSLIQRIAETPKQEIASHSFSHIYSLEAGMTDAAFDSDLNAAIAVAGQQDISLKSFVFPRNQVNLAHVKLCQAKGLTAYRGTEKSKIYHPQSAIGKGQLKRLGRLADSYFNLSGHHGFIPKMAGSSINLPSSRFLRPYAPRLRPLEDRRINRTLESMRYCAENKYFFHLWTHPHNFGVNQDENLAALSQIMNCAKQLDAEFGWPSYSMAEAARLETLER